MATDPLIGQHLDEYRLLSLLGQGGMARVYLGLDVRLKRYVSIKVIDPPFRADPSYVHRFEREAQAVAQLEHPHVVRLYRYGEARGLLYMAMQYVEGADLDSMLASTRQNGEFLLPHDASRIVHELCQALDYAHGRGVIHRDVKPSNIILDREGHAFLTDFGLALWAEPETRDEVFGTPHFMAPEQITAGGSVTPKTDLYAVGVILYQIFTGELPFDAQNPMDVAWMQVNQQPRGPRAVRPAISPAVEAVILKAMAKNPADRYPGGEALASALERALTAVPAGALAPAAALPTPSIPDRVTIELGRNPPLPPAETIFAGEAVLPPRTAPPPRRPLPAAARPLTATPEPRPPTGAATASGGQPRGSWRGLAGCLVLLLVVAGLTALAFWVAGRGIELVSGSTWPWQSGTTRTTDVPAPTAEPSAVLPPTATQVPAPEPTTVPTLEPTVEPTPEPTATPAPPLPPPRQAYQLQIFSEPDQNLVLVNRSAGPFPVMPLRLGDGEAAIGGPEWNLDSLPAGGCVLLISRGGKIAAPRGLCGDIRQHAIRDVDAFWNQAYNVYYNDRQVATCTQSECTFEITISP